ncbi:hypothetical protein GGS23DRAFT_140897 [Durotheca rogersii]|uniref:uncharacterized protein n=1 Tax=Durotheca rogersii TaxID=419775 RepID=UPI002220A94B|nr:uncharacterized protein GGS23DRAFT_140897 [Durotheca rogersii]KAI5861593.1 hypothetical protein GGS23DRAFT_140897 [Durotheca rogersii]
MAVSKHGRPGQSLQREAEGDGDGPRKPGVASHRLALSRSLRSKPPCHAHQAQRQAPERDHCQHSATCITLNWHGRVLTNSPGYYYCRRVVPSFLNIALILVSMRSIGVELVSFSWCLCASQNRRRVLFSSVMLLAFRPCLCSFASIAGLPWYLDFSPPRLGFVSRHPLLFFSVPLYRHSFFCPSRHSLLGPPTTHSIVSLSQA